jgi:hypothetical protein
MIVASSRPGVAGAACRKIIMIDAVYIGIAVAFFAAFLLYARGCEKL